MTDPAAFDRSAGAPECPPDSRLWGALNYAICVSGIGHRGEWGCLLVDRMPDLGLCGGGTQVFPLWRWDGLRWHPNITDRMLDSFRRAAGDDIDRVDTFFYIYGTLHDSSFRRRFAHDLFRQLPRVPRPPDASAFEAFRSAGERLGRLHCLWDRGEAGAWPLRIERHPDSGRGPLRDADFKLRPGAALRWDRRPDGVPDKTRLRVGRRAVLASIPDEAHRYSVAGRTPLEWQIRYLRVSVDKRSGIVNDANDAFRHPREIVERLRRVTAMSVQSARTIATLPELFPPRAEVSQ